MKERIESFKLRALLKYPYLSFVLCALKVSDNPTALPYKTMAVSKNGVLYWDADLILRYEDGELSDDDFVFLLAHEAMHLVLKHFERGANFNSALWQIACDLEINDDLDMTNVSLRPYTPSDFRLPSGKTAEYYCAHLNLTAAKYKFDSGSAVDGIQRVWETDEEGENIDYAVRLTWERVKEAGDAPANLKRIVSSLLAPKVNWRTELSNAVHSFYNQKLCDLMTRSYKRASRRHHCDQSIILPGWIGFKPIVGILIDTSGSIDEGELAVFVSEALSICRNYEDVYIAGADVKLHKVVRTPSKVHEVLIGGGGTNLGKAIDEFLSQAKIDILVVFTDGFTPWESELMANKNFRRPKTVICLTADKKGLPEWCDKVIYINATM